MRTLLLVMVALARLHAAPAPQTFIGTVADDMCAVRGHDRMQMGPTDAECARECIRAHGAAYVLIDGRKIYTLSDQQTPESFAGQKVKVVGTLNAKTMTIHVQSIVSSR